MTDIPGSFVDLEPVGTWAEVLAETRAAGRSIEPFQVVEGLTLSPPTPERARQIKVASWSHTAASASALQAAVNGATQEDLDRIGVQLQEAEATYNEALFGPDVYPRVVEYFADKPNWQRDAFAAAVKSRFLQLPSDGKCPTCKQVIAPEQTGKADARVSNRNEVDDETEAPQPETAPAAAN